MMRGENSTKLGLKKIFYFKLFNVTSMVFERSLLWFESMAIY
jgi:hypothetical protein